MLTGKCDSLQSRPSDAADRSKFLQHYGISLYFDLPSKVRAISSGQVSPRRRVMRFLDNAADKTHTRADEF